MHLNSGVNRYGIFDVVSSADASSQSDLDKSTDVQAVSVTVDWVERTAVLTASGEIDMVTAPQFESALTSIVAQQPEVLVVDLSGVGFFASAGLSALAVTYQQAGDDIAVRVVAPNSATARPLQVTALDRRIPIFTSREQALT